MVRRVTRSYGSHLASGCLLATLLLGGCSPGDGTVQQRWAARELPHPFGVVVGMAWPTDDQLVVTQGDVDSRPYTFSTYVLDPLQGGRARLELPGREGCERVMYGWPQPLADGRVSMQATCLFPRGSSPSASSAAVAVDPVSGEVEVLSQLGTELSPSGSSWDPAVERGVAAESSSICARLFGIDRSGPTPLPVRLGEGDDSWLADAVLPSGCTKGRADWPAWSPDGKTIAFFSSPKSVGEEGVGRLDAPWQLLLMDPDTLQTRVLVEGVEHARATTWSPDGRWLAYIAEEDGVFVVSAAGGRPRQVSEEPARWLAWSPDGDELAVAGAAPGSSATEQSDRLLILDASGLEP